MIARGFLASPNGWALVGLAVVLFALAGLPQVDTEVDLARVQAAHANLDEIPETYLIVGLRPGIESVVADARERLVAVDGVLDVHARLDVPPGLEARDARALGLRPRIAGGRGLAGLALRVDPDVSDRMVVTDVRAALDDVPELESALLGGLPVLNVAHAEAGRRAQVALLAGVVLVFLALLAVLTRTLAGVLLPLASVVSAAAVVSGYLGWQGASLGGPNLLLLPLVLVFGLADSVHLLRRFELERAQGADGALARALDAVAPACLLTSLTTAGGFAALHVTGSRVLGEFGSHATVGMMVAWAFGLGIPAWVLWRWPQIPAVGRVATRPAPTAWVQRVQRHPRVTSAFVLAVVLGAAWPASTVRSEVRVGGELPDGSAALADHRQLDTQLGGSAPLILRIEASPPHDPEVYNELFRLEQYLGHSEVVGFRLTPITLATKVARTIGRDESALVGVSDTPAFIRRAGWSRVADAIRAAPTPAGLPIAEADETWLAQLRLKDHGAAAWAAWAADLHTLGDRLPHLSLSLSGYPTVAIAAWQRLWTDLLAIVGLTLAGTSLLLGLAYRSWRVAWVVAVPVAGTCTCTLAVLAVADIALTPPKLFVLSAAVGVGVDALIHLFSHARHDVAGGGDAREAVRRALASTGVAVGWGYTLLLTGLAVLLTSELQTVREIGAALLAGMGCNLVLVALSVTVWGDWALAERGTQASANQAK